MNLKNLSIVAITYVGSHAAVATAAAPNGRLLNAQADLAIQTLEHFYGVRATPTPDGAKSLHVDRITCSLPASAAEPGCTLTVGGKALPQPVFAAGDANANLFQLLADAGALRSSAGGLTATATALDCATGSDYGPGAFCEVKGIVPAAAPAAAPKEVYFGGPAADDLLRSMMHLGVPSNAPAHTQYIWSNKADSVVCTVEVKQPYRNYPKPASCSLVTNGVAITAQGDDALLFYRLIAESGGASLDRDSTYVAAAGAFACVNGNTHSGGHATCTITLPNPRQVLTNLKSYSTDQAAKFSGLLRSWSAEVYETPDATVTKVAALECTMPTEQHFGIEAVDCRSSGDGSAVTTVSARRDNGDQLVGLAGVFGIGPYAGRLDRNHPDNTKFYGSVACTVNKTAAFPDGCQGFLLNVAPL